MTNDLQPVEWNFCPKCGGALVPRRDDLQERPHCNVCQRHYYSNPTPAACCFVVREDKLLLGQRGIEPRRGYWGLPGGYVERGETTQEGALRELTEETSLRGSRAQLIGVSSQASVMTGSVIVHGYHIEEWEGEPSPASDVMALRFFAKEELPRLPFRAHRELYDIFVAIQNGIRPIPATAQTQPVAGVGSGNAAL